MKLYLQCRAFRLLHAGTGVMAPGATTEDEKAQLDAKEQHLQRCLFGQSSIA